jgi:hypothetical protein
MTRKDYQKVADIIRKHLNESWDDSSELAVGNIAQDLAGMFATDNERFDASRFYTACGLNDLARAQSQSDAIVADLARDEARRIDERLARLLA